MTLNATPAVAQARGPFWSWSPSMPVLVGLGIQLAAAIWWTASLDARVQSLEKVQADLAAMPAELARLDERSQEQSLQLTRLSAEADRRDGAAADH